MITVHSVYGTADAAKAALMNGALQKATLSVVSVSTGNAIVGFTNENILAGSLQLQKASVSNEVLELGSAVSDELRVTVYATAPIASAIINQRITLTIEWGTREEANDGTIYPFTGIITEVHKERDGVYSIVALDALIAFDKPIKVTQRVDPTGGQDPDFWGFPCVLDIFRSICISYGAPYVSTSRVVFPTRSTIPNADLRVPWSDLDGKGYTCRQIMKWCAEIMACRIKIDSSDAAHPVALCFTDQSSLSTPLDAGDLLFSRAVGEKFDNSAESVYMLRIFEGETPVYDPMESGNFRFIEIHNNPLVRSIIKSEQVSVDVFGTAIFDQVVNMIPLNTVSWQSNGVTMPWYEPWDCVAWTLPNNETAVVLLTDVKYVLNGGMELEAKVTPKLEGGTQTSPAFNSGQQEVLNAAFDDVNEDIGTLDASVGNLQTGLNTANGNITSLQNAITTLNNALFYKAGDTIAGTGDNAPNLWAYGCRTDATKLRVVIQLDKIIPTGLTATISLVTFGYLCTGTGGRVGGSNFNATTYIKNHTTCGNTIQIQFEKSDGWADGLGNAIPNYSAVAGLVRLGITFS